jgi:hypothetical protein
MNPTEGEAWGILCKVRISKRRITEKRRKSRKRPFT